MKLIFGIGKFAIEILVVNIIHCVTKLDLYLPRWLLENLIRFESQFWNVFTKKISHENIPSKTTSKWKNSSFYWFWKPITRERIFGLLVNPGSGKNPHGLTGTISAESGDQLRQLVVNSKC